MSNFGLTKNASKDEGAESWFGPSVAALIFAFCGYVVFCENFL